MKQKISFFKIFILIGISIFLISKCHAQVPQLINQWYEFKASDDSIEHKLPTIAPIAPYKRKGSTYYNSADSAIHWWTGFTDRTFTGGGSAALSNTFIGYGNSSNVLTGTGELNYIHSDSTLTTPYEIVGSGNRLIKSLVTLRIPDTTNWDILHIPTQQGDTASHGGVEGDFSLGLNQTFVNPDGQRDAALYLGYNLAAPGVRRNTKDASSSLIFESHFIQGVKQTETYLEMVDTANHSVRPIAFDVNIFTNVTQELHQVSSLSYEDASGTFNWMQSDTTAQLRLTGSQAAISLTNDNGGGASITPTNDGFGNVAITNNGAGHFNFNSDGIFQSKGITSSAMLSLNGNTGANQIGISMTSGGGSGSFLPINVAESNPGGQACIFANNASGAFNAIDIGAHAGSALTYYNDNSIVRGFSVGMDADSTFKIAYNSQAFFANGILFYLDRNGRCSIGASPSTDAVLSLSSTTRGFLCPRMTTTQKLAITTPDEGLQVYDLTLHQMSYFNGTSWVNF